MKRKGGQLEAAAAAATGFNHGVSWLRGPLIGKGGFGSVYLAHLKNPKSRNRCFPSIMAVKSAEVSASASLQKEKEVFNSLNGCPYILKCFGEETTISKDGEMIYNVLLEYACGGTLSGPIKKSNGVGLPELDVRRYTRCILQGIDYIHREGYVHCDLKSENILLVASSKRGDGSVGEFVPKIGDFGLAKKSEKSHKKRKFDPYIRGTALYLAPETVVDHVQEPPSDIWALGCIVFEMLTGKAAWDLNDDLTTDELLKKIGDRFELPKIPAGISKEGKDFLKGCLVRKPMFRLTAEMLLDHPFVSGVKQGEDCGEMLEISDAFGAWSEADDDVDDEECSASCSSDGWSFTSEEDFSISSCSVDAEEGSSTASAALIAEDVDGFKPLAVVSSKTVPKFPPLCSIPAGA